MSPKRIILLLDGTWNDSAWGLHDTNIVRLRQIIARSLDPASSLIDRGKRATEMSEGERMVAGGTYAGADREHIVFYERGVGTGPTDWVRGGAFGKGLDGNIRRAYKFLSHHYKPGDQIFIFGFSRGAYTARSLVGYIGAAGLLVREKCTAELESIAWNYYRTPPNDRMPGVWAMLEPFVHRRGDFRIDCVGVFDTVGALGVPLKALWRLNRQRYEFHDVELSSITRLNLHALAVDEHRHPFQAAVWRKPKFKTFATVTEQVWFPGAHADIGGSYVDETQRDKEALDDITLDWMLKRVKRHYPDFPFDPQNAWKDIGAPWALAPAHNARKHVYRLWPLARRMVANFPGRRRRWRRESLVCWDRHADPIAEMMHVSVLLRLGKDVIINRRERSYRPDNILTVLEDIAATYTLPRPAHRTRPDILVVDWSGAPIKPDAQGCQGVTKMIQEARQRMR
jgi:hypothetical protein